MNLMRLITITIILVILGSPQTDSHVVTMLLLAKIIALKGAVFLGLPLAIGSFLLGQGLGFFGGKIFGGYTIYSLAHKYHKHKAWLHQYNPYYNKYQLNNLHGYSYYSHPYNYRPHGWGWSARNSPYLTPSGTRSIPVVRDQQMSADEELALIRKLQDQVFRGNQKRPGNKGRRFNPVSRSNEGVKPEVDEIATGNEGHLHLEHDPNDLASSPEFISSLTHSENRQPTSAEMIKDEPVTGPRGSSSGPSGPSGPGSNKAPGEVWWTRQGMKNMMNSAEAKVERSFQDNRWIRPSPLRGGAPEEDDHPQEFEESQLLSEEQEPDNEASGTTPPDYYYRSLENYYSDLPTYTRSPPRGIPTHRPGPYPPPPGVFSTTSIPLGSYEDEAIRGMTHYELTPQGSYRFRHPTSAYRQLASGLHQNKYLPRDPPSVTEAYQPQARTPCTIAKIVTSAATPNPVIEKYLEDKLREEMRSVKSKERRRDAAQLMKMLRFVYMEELMDHLTESYDDEHGGRRRAGGAGLPDFKPFPTFVPNSTTNTASSNQVTATVKKGEEEGEEEEEPKSEEKPKDKSKIKNGTDAEDDVPLDVPVPSRKLLPPLASATSHYYTHPGFFDNGQRNKRQTILADPQGHTQDVETFKSDIGKFFLLVSLLDQDKCLQKLVCDVHSRPLMPDASAYERNIIITFQVIQAVFPMHVEHSTTSYRKAAKIGEIGKSLKICAKAYPSCTYDSKEIISMGNGLNLGGALDPGQGAAESPPGGERPEDRRDDYYDSSYARFFSGMM